MSKRQTTTITLPTERASQLRDIAAAHGLSLTEYICKHIENEIRAGIISDEIPGFGIKIVKRLIEFCFPGATMTLTKQQAAEIAKDLETDEPYGFVPLANDDVFMLRRQGRGLVIKFYAHGKSKQIRRGLSPSTARDLARLLRNAIKRLR